MSLAARTPHQKRAAKIVKLNDEFCSLAERAYRPEATLPQIMEALVAHRRLYRFWRATDEANPNRDPADAVIIAERELANLQSLFDRMCFYISDNAGVSVEIAAEMVRSAFLKPTIQ